MSIEVREAQRTSNKQGQERKSPSDITKMFKAEREKDKSHIKAGPLDNTQLFFCIFY